MGVEHRISLPRGVIEVNDVVLWTKGLTPEAHPVLGPPAQVGDAQIGDGAHPGGLQHGHGPNHEGPPVVAHKDRFFVPVVGQEILEIVGEGRDVVGLDGLRAAAAAVAPLVRDDNVEARGGEDGNLVTPAIGVLWPAVAEHDGGSPGRS